MAIQKPSPSYAEIGAFEKHLKPDPDPRTDIRRALAPLTVYQIVLPGENDTPQITVAQVVIPNGENSKHAKIRAYLESLYPDVAGTIARMAQYIQAQRIGAHIDTEPIRWDGRWMITVEWVE